MDIKEKNQKKATRARRVRAKVSGTTTRPRLSVFFSNKHVVAQIINDETGNTLVYKSDKSIKKDGNSVEIASEIGKDLAKEAVAKKIKTVVFDKGSKKYHGKVKSLAEGAREGGLEF